MLARFLCLEEIFLVLRDLELDLSLEERLLAVDLESDLHFARVLEGDLLLVSGGDLLTVTDTFLLP